MPTPARNWSPTTPAAMAPKACEPLRSRWNLLERLDPDRYVSMLNGFVKMQQIFGKDIDPEGYYQAVKYSLTGGEVGSDEFMSMYLPMMIAEVGGPNAGNSIRAGFDQFVVGRASKQALAAQEK
ncbi:hypothetical protein FJ414_23410 [Mesorhizobium sp. B3-1-6]|uniref:hypothetical protein n=1 Tax=Mesorhizobium sp. B3-1-6 TaxID=2589895 RepID=UPI00112E82E6|nr:hypothetical protein [Mesorhizobium sp. B3-1-6]TPI31509.1 hypothetical protein FJ414_23410 [Mesorhizobium sp. B3-1-6]